MRRLAALLTVILVLTLVAGALIERTARRPEPGWMKYRTGRQPVGQGQSPEGRPSAPPR